MRTELDAHEGHLAEKIEIVALKIDAVTPDVGSKKQKDQRKRAAGEDAAEAVSRHR